MKRVLASLFIMVLTVSLSSCVNSSRDAEVVPDQNEAAQTACEDLSRAIDFIFEHADELQVDTDGYSLWGGSAGGRMADWVGTSDGIANWRTMKARLDTMSEMGIPTEFHSYDGLPHGFGLGTGTAGEGWIDDAVAFWEKQM